MLVSFAKLLPQDCRARSANRSSLLAIQLVGVKGDLQHLLGLVDLFVQLLELQLPQTDLFGAQSDASWQDEDWNHDV